jgi:hypothetical protein
MNNKNRGIRRRLDMVITTFPAQRSLASYLIAVGLVGSMVLGLVAGDWWLVAEAIGKISGGLRISVVPPPALRLDCSRAGLPIIFSIASANALLATDQLNGFALGCQPAQFYRTQAAVQKLRLGHTSIVLNVSGPRTNP